MKYEKLENMKSFQSRYEIIDNKYYSDNLLANKKLEEQDKMTRKNLQNKINKRVEDAKNIKNTLSDLQSKKTSPLPSEMIDRIAKENASYAEQSKEKNEELEWMENQTIVDQHLIKKWDKIYNDKVLLIPISLDQYVNDIVHEALQDVFLEKNESNDVTKIFFIVSSSAILNNDSFEKILIQLDEKKEKSSIDIVSGELRIDKNTTIKCLKGNHKIYELTDKTYRENVTRFKKEFDEDEYLATSGTFGSYHFEPLKPNLNVWMLEINKFKNKN